MDFKNMYKDIGKQLEELKKLDKPIIRVKEYEIDKQFCNGVYVYSIINAETTKYNSLEYHTDDYEEKENTLITDDFIFIKE
jgi:adenine/guanine phosphoribosyltransferase-like PRPP-binding protein